MIFTVFWAVNENKSCYVHFTERNDISGKVTLYT